MWVSSASCVVLASGLALAAANAVAFDILTPSTNYTSACLPGDADNGHYCQTDNAAVSYYAKNGDQAYALESGDISTLKYWVNNDYGGETDLTTTYDDSPVWEGAGETDIIYQEGTVSGDAEGRNWCDDPQDDSTYACDQQYVRIEPGNYQHGLICHESGHALGLMHGNWATPTLAKDDTRLGCMVTPVGTTVGISNMMINNINEEY